MIMYFWNTRALSEDLRAGRVSQHEKMKYLLAGTLTFSVGSYLLVPEEPSTLLAVDALITAVITVGGVLACYRANRRGDNEEFIDRFICLSWPVGIRVVTAIAAVYFIYGTIGYAIDEERFDAFFTQLNVVDLVIFGAAQIVGYWRVRTHILRTSGAVASPITATEVQASVSNHGRSRRNRAGFLALVAATISFASLVLLALFLVVVGFLAESNPYAIPEGSAVEALVGLMVIALAAGFILGALVALVLGVIALRERRASRRV